MKINRFTEKYITDYILLTIGLTGMTHTIKKATVKSAGTFKGQTKLDYSTSGQTSTELSVTRTPYHPAQN